MPSFAACPFAGFVMTESEAFWSSGAAAMFAGLRLGLSHASKSRFVVQGKEAEEYG